MKDRQTRGARSPTLPMQKRPVVVTGRFLCLSKANRAISLHVLQGTGHLFPPVALRHLPGTRAKVLGRERGQLSENCKKGVLYMVRDQKSGN